MSELSELRRAALSIFSSALESVDAIGALRRSVKLQDARLKILDSTFDLHSTPHIYAIAIGKAARAMAYALEEVLGERIISAVVSAPAETTARPLSSRWQIFTGGHPLPNQESLNAARRAFELLDEANREDALIIFLVSGGGSAMIEWPRDLSVTLDDLCQTNRVLVSCGADISEVNSIRRALSSVKGGGLARRASRAAQVTLIVSDVNTGREFDVASGPSIQQPSETFNPAIVVEKYKLQSRLPSTILDALKNFSHDENSSQQTVAPRKHYVLLNNADALDAAAKTARAQGFVVEKAEEIIEQPVAEGAAALVSRLNDLYLREGGNGRGVCLISGGEFACPVRGSGLGGRSSETALRAALEFERLLKNRADKTLPRRFIALCAGTDGIDGNSSAAGAISDQTTLTRARAQNLDAQIFLSGSNSYSFFAALGDALTTGPTGTNVRDLRIFLAE